MSDDWDSMNSDEHQPTEQPRLPEPAAVPNTEQVRQFEEFQRFQEYLRLRQQVEQQPDEPLLRVPANSRDTQRQLAHVRQQLAALAASQTRIERATNPPIWRKLLRSRLLSWLVGLAVLVVVTIWGIPALVHHYLGGTDSDHSGASLHPGAIEGDHRLETKPGLTVGVVYAMIADDQPVHACLEFRPSGAKQFAADMGAASCQQAITTLHSQLSNEAAKNAYLSLEDTMPDSALTPQDWNSVPAGGTVMISSCQIRADNELAAGRPLGLFIVSKNDYDEWIITGHHAEPDPCPATPPSSSDLQLPTS